MGKSIDLEMCSLSKIFMTPILTQVAVMGSSEYALVRLIYPILLRLSVHIHLLPQSPVMLEHLKITTFSPYPIHSKENNQYNLKYFIFGK